MQAKWETFLPQRKRIRLGGHAWLLNGSVVLQTSMAARKRNIHREVNLVLKQILKNPVRPAGHFLEEGSKTHDLATSVLSIMCK